MPKPCHVYLIPGFFGFANIGGITYFHHVTDILEQTLEARGYEAKFHPVKTLPTASLEERCTKLFHAVDGDEPDGEIFLVGHSTGGVDARMFVSPSTRLAGIEPQRLEYWASRVESVVSVCSPNRGTPMADFFDTLSGAELLYILSLATIYTMRFGRLPLAIVAGLGGILTRVDDLVGMDNTIFDQIYDHLLDDFEEASEEEIKAFLANIRRDRSLIAELRPARMARFSDECPDRETVRYGSVVLRAPTPGWRTTSEAGLNPYHQATHALYRGLHYLTSRTGNLPELPLEHRNVLYETYGDHFGSKDSDGVVPTYSHPWGRVIHRGRGDHLDACGHFEDKNHAPPHVDWLKSGSAFTRTDFERLWRDVADFLADDS